MSDIEGSWKPNGRPQSTIAQNFSAALNDAFSIDSSPSGPDGNLKGLTQSVQQKKQAVDSQNQELEALEARLRETEERLRQKQSVNSSPAAKAGANNTSYQTQPLGATFSGRDGNRSQDAATIPLATQPRRPLPTFRETSYQTPLMPGALPQTPG